MSKTVLISLAAVLALIVIVVLLGMRYLRADDEEEVGEENAIGRDSSGRRSGHLARERHVRVRSRPDDLEDARTGGGSGGAVPARRTHRPEMRSGVRTEQDGRWREDSSEMARAGRPRQRDQHLVTAGRAPTRDYADTSEPGRRGSAREFDHESVDRHERRDPRAGRDGRATRDGWDQVERGTTRPSARADARADAAKPDSDSLPAVKPRAGRSKRESEGDWPTTDWDELSDVDYWAELAADKPLTTATPTAGGSRPPRREPRHEPRRGYDPRPGRDVLAGELRAAAGGELPVKQVRRQERASERDMAPAASRATEARATAPRPVAADDDPLTSPSFPRVRTEDSRSYRRTRNAGSEPLQPASHSGSMPAVSSAYPPAHGYPATAADHTHNGYTDSTPASYQLPAAGPGSHRAHADYPGLPGATPSYSPPADPAGGYPAPGYPAPVPHTGAGNGDAGYRGEDSYLNSLPPANGNQAPAGYAFSGEQAAYDARHTAHGDGYRDHWPPSGAFAGHEATPGYQPAYPDPAPGGHSAPYQPPSTQLPGYPDRGDPYAADPYGLPGYGGSGY